MNSETILLVLQEKYDLLSTEQKEIFAGYGLRQIKHFVEISLPHIEPSLPQNALIQGVNTEGKIQAIDPNTQQNYVWISDLQWQEYAMVHLRIDLTEDFLEIWKIFNLAAYPLIDLSHIHRDFLAKQAL